MYQMKKKQHFWQGDQVEEFQPLCEVQSDKATIEITSRYKGKVSEILHVPGNVIKVIQKLLDLYLLMLSWSYTGLMPHPKLDSGLGEDLIVLKFDALFWFERLWHALALWNRPSSPNFIMSPFYPMFPLLPFFLLQKHSVLIFCSNFKSMFLEFMIIGFFLQWLQ